LFLQQAKHVLTLCGLHGMQVEEESVPRSPQLYQTDLALALQLSLCTGGTNIVGIYQKVRACLSRIGTKMSS